MVYWAAGSAIAAVAGSFAPAESLRNINQYATGITVEMNTMVVRVPKQITVPIGDHRALRLRIIGITPIEAAAEVRNIGRIRRIPACWAASRTLMPLSRCNSSA